MSSSMHDVRFPGEGAEYRAARDDLLWAQVELRRQTEAVPGRSRRASPTSRANAAGVRCGPGPYNAPRPGVSFHTVSCVPAFPFDADGTGHRTSGFLDS